MTHQKLNPTRINSFSSNFWANVDYGIFPPYISTIDNVNIEKYYSFRLIYDIPNNV